MKAQKSASLADSSARPALSPRISVLIGLVGVSLLGVVAATAVMPDQDQASMSSVAILETLKKPTIEILPAPGLPFVFEERIQSGDTLQSLFRRIGIDDADALAFVSSSDEGKEALRKLRAGRSVLAVVDPNGRLLSLTLPVAAGPERLTLERTEEGLRYTERAARSTQTVVEMHSGTITHSLFGATDAAGVPDRIASKFAEIFGTEIDFSRDLREGDRFSVVYETEFDQGVPVRSGRVLAAEFVNQGKRHAVVLYREPDGNETYYTPDGKGLNQAFLRYPLEFTRVSSNFGRRLHPIHGNWRSHNGTDFAAPTGTPVMASSDGRVDFVGDQRGYGKTVIIDHRENYSTLYAHMNGFAKSITKGQRIRQGDVIGYVGATGWATGPHLHYEIRISGVPRDPMQIALPPVLPLDKKEMAQFKAATSPLLERLSRLNYGSTTNVASAN
nr:peptidoglycan DD-metalloendopeptidase family protein [Zoogloeaceae bacterium]